MTYLADFADAHRRHWQDAQLLSKHERWANAGHLYGLSAECGLKAIMKILGMAVDSTGKPSAREHQIHMPELWHTFDSFAAHRNGARFRRRSSSGNPFATWSIHDRYAHRCHFGQAQVERWHDAAAEICGAVERATMESQP